MARLRTEFIANNCRMSHNIEEKNLLRQILSQMTISFQLNVNFNSSVNHCASTSILLKNINLHKQNGE